MRAHQGLQEVEGAVEPAAGSFEKKALPVGAKLTITETKPGALKSVKILTIRKSKRPSLATH